MIMFESMMHRKKLANQAKHMRVWIKIIINGFQNLVYMNDTLSDNLTNEEDGIQPI